jgi:hypothetical protein
MNQNNQNIQPATQTTTVIITSFRVDLRDLILSVSATFRVTLCNSDGVPLTNLILLMEGDDYTRWNNDDTYVYQFVADKLGFILV